MKVMVAIEPRVYRDAIGEAMQSLRPRLEVAVAEPCELGTQVECQGTDLVLCGQRKPGKCEDGPAWIDYRPYASPTATVCIRGRCEKVEVARLGDLLAIVDRAEELARGCTP